MADPALALADPAAAARILRVLLDNAANYGDGEVAVTFEPGAAIVVLAVQDEGPGLAPEEAERVFRRFARGAPPERRTARGSAWPSPAGSPRRWTARWRRMWGRRARASV